MQKLKQSFVILSVIFGFFAAAGLVYAYVEAPGTATYCPSGYPGCDAPINISAVSQYKAGAFGIGGLLMAPYIQLTSGAGAGKVLTSDATGFASWQALGGGLWQTSGNNTYYSAGNVAVMPGSSYEYSPAFGVGSGCGGVDAAVCAYGKSTYVENDPYNQYAPNSITKTLGVLAVGQDTGVYADGRVAVEANGWASPQGIGVDATAGSIGVQGEAYGQNGMTSAIGVMGISAARDTVANGGAGKDIGVGVQGNGNWYDFFAAGSGTDYGSASSFRWKENITPIPNALDKVINLRGVYFDWKKDHGGQHDAGMIAEEVFKVYPEIVAMDPNAPGFASGMDYGKLTPLLVEAIKEQQKKMDLQQKQIDELKAGLNSCVKK